MDLVGEANEAKFAFQIPKNTDGKLPLSLEEFVQQGGTSQGVRPEGEKGGEVIRQNYDPEAGYVEKFQGVFTPYIQDLIAIGKGEKPEVDTPYEVIKYLDRETQYMERMREGLEPVKNTIDRFRKPVQVEVQELVDTARQQLNPGKPVRFKVTELHRLITQNPIIR